MQLTQNIYVETGLAGSNVGYIVTDTGVVMVDTPYRPTDAVAVRRDIEAKGKLRYLINTEPHDDHYAGCYFFDVPAIAQEQTREVMLTADIPQIKNTVAVIDPEGYSLMDDYCLNLPSITFSERMTLYMGHHTLHLIHLPGHTVSQTSVFIPEEKVVFTGDNVTYQIKGFLHEADPFAWLESLKVIGELDADYIVPGHGEVCDKSYLKEEADYIQGAIDAVRQAIAKGMSREEAVDTVDFPSPYPLDEGSEAVADGLMKRGIGNLYDRIAGK